MSSPSPMRALLPLFAGLLIAALALPARAELPLHFNGFATLGLTVGDDELLGFRRGLDGAKASRDGDPRLDVDSLLGLQLNVELSPRLDFTVQGVVRERAQQSLNETTEWAFLRLQADEHSDFRVGRLGLDVFMLADYRQVGYAYPWVRPAPDFYGGIPIFRFDGADYTRRFTAAGGSLQAKLFVGRSESTLPISTPSTDRFNLALDTSWGLTLLWERDSWQLRGSYVGVEFGSDPPLSDLFEAADLAADLWPEAPAIAERLRFKGAQLDYLSVGLRYDSGPWLVHAEIARLDADRDSLSQQDAAYLSVARRFGPFTGFVQIAAAVPHHSPVRFALPDGLSANLAELLEPLRAGFEDTINGTRIEQRGAGLGLRWDFAPGKALKLQWDRWKVDKDGNSIWLLDGATQHEDRGVNVLSASVDFVF